MKYINIPKKDNLTIDVSAITNNCKGIIIAYKGNIAVGRISCCTCLNRACWYFYDSIDDQKDVLSRDTLLELINELIDTKHIADNFRLLEFYTDNNDQQARHFTRSFT